MKNLKLLKLSGISVTCLLLSVCLTGCQGGKPEPQDMTDIPEITEYTEHTVHTENPETAEDTTDAEITPDVSGYVDDRLSQQVIPGAGFGETNFNAHSFEDGLYDFVSVPDAQQILSVEMVELGGNDRLNQVLRLTDNADTGEQEICIAVDKLLSPDQLETVYSIGFDMYILPEMATEEEQAALYGVVTGTTVCADGAYTFEPAVFSDTGHAVLVFAQADQGKRWDSSQGTVELRLTRSAFPVNSDFFLDNLVFYDQEGNSIPLSPSYPVQG